MGLEGFRLHNTKLAVSLFFLEKGLADIVDSCFLLSDFVTLEFLFLEVFVIEPELDYFFHHEYFGEHVCIVNFIDLVAHEDGLFVGLVVELCNLVDTLFCFLDVLLVVIVFLLVVVDGFRELLFLFVQFFELVNANVSGEGSFD